MKTCSNCKQSLAEDAIFCLSCGTSQVADGEDVLIGTVVAQRYLVKERIGAGGSGTVYLARHVTLQKRVALKVLHHHLCQDDAAVERFRREATTMAQIDNEHIIGVGDFGRTDDGRLYLAMELLEGETLADLLEREGPLSIPRALSIFNQVAEALAEAHGKGYVHRDLRPANVFLTTRRDQTDFVKVMDFGLSKLVLSELEPGQVTVGMSFGDPRYLSPEQAAGEKVDRRADVYALGIVLYEMLSGVPPFVGDDVFTVINKHLRERPAPASSHNPSLPAVFDEILDCALAKDRKKRWSSVELMREALTRASISSTMPGLGAGAGRGAGGSPAGEQSPSGSAGPAGSAPGAGLDRPEETVMGMGPPAALASALARAGGSPVAADAGGAAPMPAEPAASDRPTPPPEKPASDPIRAAPLPVDPSPPESPPRPGGPPDRPDGSGPHPAISEPRSEPPGARQGGTAVEEGSRSPASPPHGPEGESLDPTMSQMWYADGEAEAAEAMAEYHAYREDQLKGRKDPDLTDPVLPGVTAEMGEVTMFGRARRARRLLLITVGLVLVVVVAVLVLVNRSKGSPDDQSSASQGSAVVGLGADAGSRARAAVQPDAEASRSRSVSQGDAGATLVVDMAVQIDGPDPGGSAHAPPRRRHQHRRPVMGTRPRPPGGAPMGTEARAATLSGRRALARGDVTTARMEFQRALTARPGYGPALAGLGEVLFEQGRYGAAIGKLRAATRAMPASVRTWVLLGNAAFRAGRYSTARAAYKYALRMRPGHPEAKKNLGLVERKLGVPGGM